VRILVTHDDDGNILSVRMSARAAGEDHGARAEAGDPISRQAFAPGKGAQDLHRIARDFRVDLGNGRPRLVRKQPGA
jgi:hypothetical protein